LHFYEINLDANYRTHFSHKQLYIYSWGLRAKDPNDVEKKDQLITRIN
jgi:hypothetical protein